MVLNTHLPVSFDMIEKAACCLKDQIVVTPFVISSKLSTQFGCDLFLKLENFQATGSFKDRGSYVKLASLDTKNHKCKVIACSAGNHALGVAYHAGRMNIPVLIVMPVSTPFAKIAKAKSLGADVELAGEDLAEAEKVARDIIAVRDYEMIHPYDDPLIIAGQGSCGLEMMNQVSGLDAIIVPIGGGGLMAGIAVAVKTINPQLSLIGVESALYPSMTAALANQPEVVGGASIAEGIAVKRAGLITRDIVRSYVDDIILVDEVMIERAMCKLAEQQCLVAEGAGAAGLAAVMQCPDLFAGRKVGIVICGGNVDASLFANVLTRGVIRDHKRVHLRISIMDRPNILGKIAGIIGREGGNIIDVHHHRMFPDMPVKMAEIDISVEIMNVDHAKQLLDALMSAGFTAREVKPSDIDDSEKYH